MANTTKSHNPHDAFCKRAFATLEYVATFLYERLPREITEQFREDVLPELVDSNFVGLGGRQSRGDMLYRVLLKSGHYIYILIEHKSQPDAKVLEQLLGYQQGIWERYGEKGARGKRTLPNVIPLVIYHGRLAWKVPQSYKDMVNADGIVEQPYGLNFRYHLVNLTDIPHDELSDHLELSAVLAVLRGYGRREEGEKNLVDILRALPDNDDGRNLKALAVWYLNEGWELDEDTLNDALSKANPKTGGKDMRFTTALVEEGIAEGETKTFKRLMGQKFGALPQAVEKQIEQASQEQVESWLDKILTAQSLEDMFPGHSMH
ncbi:MAG: Rpn family recombination-promoting nuclease/putative transposase [Pseudohongiellaceae bacterium]